jgi:hypothetical protein
MCKQWIHQASAIGIELVLGSHGRMAACQRIFSLCSGLKGLPNVDQILSKQKFLVLERIPKSSLLDPCVPVFWMTTIGRSER